MVVEVVDVEASWVRSLGSPQAYLCNWTKVGVVVRGDFLYSNYLTVSVKIFLVESILNRCFMTP